MSIVNKQTATITGEKKKNINTTVTNGECQLSDKLNFKYNDH